MNKKNINVKILNAIKYITIKQWNIIDEEYKINNTFDLKAVSVFIAGAFVLIISEYFCSSNYVKNIKPLFSYLMKLQYPALSLELYWAIATSLNYFLLPAIVIKFIFKERIIDYGFKFKKKSTILILYAGMFILVFPFIYAVSSSPVFLNKYPFYKYAANSFFELFIWELGYALQFFTLEFFFRGFLLFTLSRYIGSYAIFVMVLPYTMIHFAKPVMETTGAIITGITLGTIALRTRSIYGGIIIHIAVAWTMDLLALFNKGQLQKLLL